MTIERVSPVLGEPRRAWCEQCSTTALVVVKILIFTKQGSTPIGEFSICENCGHTPYTDHHNPSG